jgi:hypothetical protein
VHQTIEAVNSNVRLYMAMSSKGVSYSQKQSSYNPEGGSEHYALPLKFGKTCYPDADKYLDPTDADISK